MLGGIAVVVLVVLRVGSARAEPNYFPLEIGNRWTYQCTLVRAPGYQHSGEAICSAPDSNARVLAEMASVLSAQPDEFIRLWIDTFNMRATGDFQTPEENVEYICRKLRLHVADAQIKLAAQVRFNFTARSMAPRPGSVEVLSHLKSKGYKTGLISDCSAETPTVWKNTPFAPLINVTVFSCLVGVKKPDPRIYHMATKQLAVEPRNCLYVGDGSSQELTGASQVGMHPVLLRLPVGDSADVYQVNSEGDEWNGPVISSLKEVLALMK